MKNYKPAKSWLKEYYKCDKTITIADSNIYYYPDNHLNFIGAEKYLKLILKILNKYGLGYNSVSFIKSQPCIYDNGNYYKDYFWSYSGKIIITCEYNICLNNKSIRRIKQNINKLNEKYEYNCIVKFLNKNITSELK